MRLSLPIAFLVFVWLLWPAVAHAQSWYNLSWSYRKSITIDFTKVNTGPHVDFPVLISLASDAGLAAHAQASGNDILFTSSDGTTKLDHDIELYTSATGALVAWVRVPSLSSSANTVIYMYYGNAAAANQQNKTGVWDANYKAVWHLAETGNGTAGEFKDSTVNANNGRGGGGTASKTPARAAAKIADGQNFDNVDDYITAPHSASLSLNMHATLSAWINMRSWGTGNDTDTIVGKHDETGTPWVAHYKLALHDSTGSGAIPQVALYKDGTDDTALAQGTGAPLLTLNTWYYVAATYSGNTAGVSARIYVNGIQTGTGSLNTVIFTSAWPVSIGGRVTTGPGPSDLVNGYIDEVRISNSVRSAAWILTEYNNQNSPPTFYAVGAETTRTSASLSTVVASPTSVPADGTTLSTITVTLKNAAGIAVAGHTVTLAPSGGSSTISAASGPSTAGGVVTFTVKDSTVQGVIYTATDTTDSVAITQTATVSFTSTVARFNVVEPGAHPVTGKIFTKVAGQNFALDIVALDATDAINTTFTGAVRVDVVDNTGAACTAKPFILRLTDQTFTTSAPNDAGRHPLSGAILTVPNVYPNAVIRVRYPPSGALITCSTDSFAIRPATLSFAVTDATRTTAGITNTLNNTVIAGATVHNAGQFFTITVTPLNGAGTPAITSNYAGSPTPVLPLGVCGGTACTASPGSGLSVGTWSATTPTGTRTTTTATYDDVGAFNLQLQDATFATATSGDGSDGTSAAQFTIPSTAAGVGRFVPDRFLVSATSITPRSDSAACSASGFTYMSEPMKANFTLTAVKFPSGTTTRYTGSWAKLALTPASSFNFGAIDGAGPTPLSSRLDQTQATVGAWSNGVATVTAPLTFSRNATPDGPYESFKLGIAPSDPDSVVLDATSLNLDADNNASLERAQIGTPTKVRFGRLRLQNASGSQLTALPVPMEAQYWNGTGFLTNTLDNCTTIALGNIALGNYQPTLGSGDTTVSVGGGFSLGVGTLRLSAPGAAKRGSVDVSVNLTAGAAGASCTTPALPASTGSGLTWLQGAWCGATYVKDPTARAAFGIYRTIDNFIYQRENYYAFATREMCGLARLSENFTG